LITYKHNGERSFSSPFLDFRKALLEIGGLRGRPKKKTSEAGGQGSLILKLEALEIIFSGRKG
jgi:hypothetical protein